VTTSSSPFGVASASSMALTWALLVSMDSLGASVLGVLLLAVATGVLLDIMQLATLGFFLTSVTPLALLISFFAAAGLASAARSCNREVVRVIAGLMVTFFSTSLIAFNSLTSLVTLPSLSTPFAAASCSLSLRGSASDVVKALSKDEPLVTISF